MMKARAVPKRKKPTYVNNWDDYFDDCPICQAMKKADLEGRDLTQEEYFESVREAKKAGGVGGIAGEDF